ncbi:MAG: ATP phosphoribosyltransferase [Verrucomicrobia bacterium]|nr:ATP phosphoribosyltransferase [Verrucomicrobiota bacterium]MBV9643358.1 ATP phosphoribosyltransferase [Verrucomicrobiota bacterium]
MNQSCLRIGLPSGSLQESTLDLFAKAGFQISGSKRSYKPTVDDSELEIRLLRAQEISRYVEHGFLDCGITGTDWIEENNSDVELIEKLEYSKSTSSATRWVLVVPTASPILSVKDLEGKRIATEAVGLTTRFLDSKGVRAKVEFSWGSTEVKVPELVDAIVDVTETGTSLAANNLRIVEIITESYPQLIGNRDSMRDAWKKSKIQRLALLLKGALNARDKVGLKMNLEELKLKDLLEKLPALRNPTIAPLAQPGWVAIETVIDEKVVREIIPELKRLGAEGIIEYPLNKVVY